MRTWLDSESDILIIELYVIFLENLKIKIRKFQITFLKKK